MKKIIQICSLFAMLFLFTAVPAIAQSTFGTDVEIPFAFNVGDHSYEAGNYIMKMEKLTTGAAVLSIRDTNTDELQTVLLNANGDGAGTEIKLVFDTVDGRRFLSKIRTTDRTYAVIKSKAQRDALKAAKASEKTVGS